MLLIALVILGYGLAELESGPMAFSIFTVVSAQSNSPHAPKTVKDAPASPLSCALKNDALLPTNVSQCAFAVQLQVITIMVGLQEVAVAMSDPFGDDAVDLDTKGYLVSAEQNARAYLDILKLRHEAPPKHGRVATDRSLPTISAKADSSKPSTPKRAPSQPKLSSPAV